MAKLKHLICCKALTKPPKDQKPPPFTGGFVPNKPAQNKVYSFDLAKVDVLFDEMILQKAIEIPHRDVIQGGITAGRRKLWMDKVSPQLVFLTGLEHHTSMAQFWLHLETEPDRMPINGLPNATRE
ncbi:unnamed protein product [Prunus armeniaca]